MFQTTHQIVYIIHVCLSNGAYPWRPAIDSLGWPKSPWRPRNPWRASGRPCRHHNLRITLATPTLIDCRGLYVVDCQKPISKLQGLTYIYIYTYKIYIVIKAHIYINMQMIISHEYMCLWSCHVGHVVDFPHRWMVFPKHVIFEVPKTSMKPDIHDWWFQRLWKLW